MWKDILIDVNCVFVGDVYLEDNCQIGPNCVITDSKIGPNSHILANSVLNESTIGPDCQIALLHAFVLGLHSGLPAKLVILSKLKKPYLALIAKQVI